MIKESLKKGLTAFQGSAPLICIWTIYLLLVGSQSLFVDVKQLQTNGFASFSPLIIFLSVSWIPFYIFVQGCTLAYARNKIQLKETCFNGLLSQGFKYFSPLLRFALTFLFLLFISLTGGAFIFILVFLGFNITSQILPSQTAILTIVSCFEVVTLSILYLLIFYTSTILVVDELNVYPAIKKSIAMTRKYFVETLILLVVIGGLYSITSIIGLVNYYLISEKLVYFGLTILGNIFYMIFQIYATSVVMNFYLSTLKQENEQMPSSPVSLK